MLFPLLKDWDLNTQPAFLNKDQKEVGHFVGRAEEIRHICNEISRKDSGCILISGHRGVGKTSVTYHSLNEIQKKNEKHIFVLINAPQLEERSTDKKLPPDSLNPIYPDNILKNLIRRLYSASNDQVGNKHNFTKELNTLYKKAVASQFKSFESSRSKEDDSSEREMGFVANFNSTKFITSVVAILGTALLKFYENPWFDLALWLTLLFLAYSSSQFSFVKKLGRKTSEATEAGELYDMDNSLGNLEFDLEVLHRKIAESGYKVIYVIDEMDKLTTEKSGQILSYFKNLFTLSKAIFIFVGGPGLYGLGKDGKPKDDLRHAEYTYFNSRYYLSRPKWSELNRFLESVMSIKEKSRQFEILKRAICYEAKNDFFDLKNSINNRVTGFGEDETPMIEHKDNFRDLKKFRLHAAISLIYEKYQSNELFGRMQNERIIQTLFEHAEGFFRHSAGASLPEPGGENLEDSVIRDFYSLLNKMRALSVKKTEEKGVDGEESQVIIYTYLGTIARDAPASLQEPMEYEKEFIEKFKSYAVLIYEIAESFRGQYPDGPTSFAEFLEEPKDLIGDYDNYGFEIAEKFEELYATYRKVSRVSLQVTRDEVENASKEVTIHQQFLKLNLSRTYANLISQVLSLETTDLTSTSDFFVAYESLLKIFVDAGSSSKVIKSSENARQILFIENSKKIEEALSQKLMKDFLKKQFATRRVIILDSSELPRKKQSRLMRINSLYATKAGSNFNKLLNYSKKFFKSLSPPPS